MNYSNWSTAPLAALPPLLRDSNSSEQPLPQVGRKGPPHSMFQGHRAARLHDPSVNQGKADLHDFGLDTIPSQRGFNKSFNAEERTTPTRSSLSIATIPVCAQPSPWNAFDRDRDQTRQYSNFATLKLQLEYELKETARLGTAYMKTADAIQRRDGHSMTLPPSAVSMQAAQEGRERTVKQRVKRKREQAPELKQSNMESSHERSLCGAESDENSEQPYQYRHRGRPRGFRDSIHTPTDPSHRSPRPKRNQARPDYTKAEIYNSAHASFASTVDSLRSPSPTPREIYESLEPQFPEFDCEWKGCKAKLINLGTLKKHISVVHSSEAREQLRCRWGRCDKLVTPVLFSKLSDVDSHVRERHIDQVVWRMGDGIGDVAGEPVVPENSERPPLYLFRKGNQAASPVNGHKVVSGFKLLKRVEELVDDRCHEASGTDSEVSDDDDDEGILAH